MHHMLYLSLKLCRIICLEKTCIYPITDIIVYQVSIDIYDFLFFISRDLLLNLAYK